MKVGESVNMAMSEDQLVTRPGGFATTDNIPNKQFVRDKLAVRTDWKPSVDNVQQYKAIKEALIFRGPIDPVAGTYLLGGVSQVEFRVPFKKRMNYLKPVGKPKKLK